jgi:peptide/nickel transport system substrate-binding protein
VKKRTTLTICLLALTILGLGQISYSQQSKTLVVALATLIPDPADLNPVQTLTTYYLALAYPDLVGWDKDGAVVPALAQSWNISPDGLTYTYKLKDGLKWSDGQPITSDDVAFTYEFITEQSAYWYWMWAPIQVPNNNTVTGYSIKPGAITTPDPLTIVIRLASPSATFFIYSAGYYVLPKHYYSGMDLSKQNPDVSTMVGSGPFVPRELVPGDRLVYDANPNYYGGKPALDQIIFKFYRDSASAEIALQTGEAQYMQDIPPQDAKALVNTPGLTVQGEQNQVNIFIYLNLHPKLADGSVNPVADLRVRKAIAMSLDLDSILKASLGSYYKLANQIQVPNMYYLGKSVTNTSIPSPNYPYDTTAAAKLLDEAGYPAGKDGTRFGLTLVLRLGRWGSAGYTMMQLVQSYLKVVGINLQVILMESGAARQRIYSAPPPKDWNMALGSISSSPDPDVNAYYLLCPLYGNADAGGFNAEGYNNPFVTQLILLGQNTTDVDQRVAIYQRISGIAYQDLPVLELYYQTEVIAWNTKLKGFVTGLGNPMHDYWGALKDTSLVQVSFVEETTTATSAATNMVTTTPSGYTMDYTTLGIAGVLVIVVGIVAFYIGRKGKSVKPAT